jgi:hypothetical protein
LDINSEASLHANAYVQSGVTNVFRYVYGAVFASKFGVITRRPRTERIAIMQMSNCSQD